MTSLCIRFGLRVTLLITTNRGLTIPTRKRFVRGLANGQVAGDIPGFCWCPEGRIEVYRFGNG